MGPKLTVLFMGFVVGVAVGIGGALLIRGQPAGEARPSGESARAEQLEDRLRERNERITDLEVSLAEREAELALARAAAEPEPPADAEGGEETVEADPAPGAGEEGEAGLTFDDLQAAIREFASGFTEYLTGGGKAQRARLRSIFAKAGAAEIERLLQAFREESDLGQKTVMAHALANSGKPEALRLLTEMVRDRQLGFFDRRVASHGLAFSDEEGLDPLLAELGRDDPERGVRANAAFGLARRGNDDGIELYAAATDEAFAERDPLAAQYLSGFFLLGKRALPVVRERIRTYEDRQARLVLIELVKSHKDPESLPVLRGIANDPAGDTGLRKAAQLAIEEIEKE